MNTINKSLSALTKTRLIVTLSFMGFTSLLLLGSGAFGWDTNLVTKVIEQTGLLCLLYVAGRSATDAVRDLSKQTKPEGRAKR